LFKNHITVQPGCILTKLLPMKIACADYRKEMMLASLVRRLEDPKLSASQKEEIRSQIKKLEQAVGLD
jgi:hypothetical protein